METTKLQSNALKNTNKTVRKKRKAWTIFRRVLLVLATLLVFALFSVYMLCFTIAKGPSETMRNMLVLSATQASATKWVPSLFLDDETVSQILESSGQVNVDIMSADEYAKIHSPDVDEESDSAAADEWEGSEGGVKLLTENGSTFKAYILLVKDPSRIFVGVSSDNFDSATAGMDVFNITQKYDALAGINGGEFLDQGGMGTGAKPMGITYSNGECVWADSSKRTFIGFDVNNRLVVSEGMSKAEADSLGIRDAVSFQTGNVLIQTVDGNINLYYSQSNTGVAQRTAIGQREDGTVIMIVTDGRTASSLGATHNDIIDMMVSYGAVNAAMLDGGSSAMLYYENYFDKYDVDKSTLDQYQLRGLVNKYKAFTNPRRIPTYFLVSKES